MRMVAAQSGQWSRRAHRGGRAALPFIASVTPPTYPGVYLLEAETFVVTGIRFKAVQGTGKLYWVNAATYAGAVAVECTIGAWADTEITATMPAVGAVGNTGFLIVVNSDGLASFGKAATALSLLVDWDYTAPKRPDGETLAVEGGVSYAGDVLNAYDDDSTDAMARYSKAKAHCDNFAADKTIAYMETSIDLNPITVLGARGDGWGIDLSALMETATLRAGFKAHTLDGADISVYARIKNGAGAGVDGEDLVITAADAHTYRVLWQRIGATGTIGFWIDATPLTVASIAPWVGTGFTTQVVDHVEVGLKYNSDDNPATLIGTNDLPAPGQSLIVVEDNTKAWGM